MIKSSHSSRRESKNTSVTEGKSALGSVEEDHVVVSSPVSIKVKNTLSSLATNPSASTEYSPITTIEKTDPIWSMYVKEAHARDTEMLEAWSTNMDVLLVFAGLFSAILTAFLIEVHQDLKESPAELTNELLLAIIQRLDFMADDTMVSPMRPFKPSEFSKDARSVRVNFFWFSSLTCSLLAAAGAMLAKEWFREYSRNSTRGSPYDQAFLRQERLDGLKHWGFEPVVDLLPTLMHIALILFFCGLIDFLWGLYTPIAAVTTGLFLCGVTFILTTVLILIFAPECPYRTSVTRKTAIFIRNAIRWSNCMRHPPSDSDSDSSLERATSKKHRKKYGAGRDNLKPLMWLLRESRYEGTVHASLKLVPALGTTADRRSQISQLGTITRLCELFDPSHPEYHRLGEQNRGVAFGIALRSLLADPRPALPNSLHLQDAIRLPLTYMNSPNRSNVNLRILAASFVPLGIMDVGSSPNATIGWEMVEEVVRHGNEVDLWARVLFLDTLQEWMIYICKGAPPALARKPENSPVVILALIARVAGTAPPNHITLTLLSAVLTSMTVTMDAHDILPVDPLNRTSPIYLGLCLGKCLDEMDRNKKSDGVPSTPGIDHTNSAAVVPLRDVEQSLIHLLSIVNRLLPHHQNMFGPSWTSSISKLIDFAHDSRNTGLVDMTLQTLLVCKHETLKMSCSLDRYKRLLRMCIMRFDIPRFGALSDGSFASILTMVEHILPYLEDAEVACQILLNNPDSLSPMFVQGLQRENDGIHQAILRIIDYCFGGAQDGDDVILDLRDEVVSRGLVKELLTRVKRTPFGPKLGDMVKTISSLGQSPASASVLLHDSALDDLIAVAQGRGSHWGNDSAARAIVLLWNSTATNGEAAERQKLTQRIIDSGILNTLSAWFENDSVGEALFKSIHELHSVWYKLLLDVAEVQPSALLPRIRRSRSPSSPSPSPSPRGLLSAMTGYVHMMSLQPNFYEPRAAERLLNDLRNLEQKIRPQSLLLTPSSASF